VWKRLLVGRSRFVAVPVAALALCAGAAMLARWVRVRSPAESTFPQRGSIPAADRTPLAGRPLHERRRSDRGGPGGDPVAAACERGVAAYNADDTDAAVDAFEEAVRLAPGEPEAHINLGLVYLRQQRPEDAMRELTKGSALVKSRERTLKRPRRNRCNE
jgi:tetratricopeptide (TPR) repeat protein